MIQLRGIEEINRALSAVWEENAGKPPKWALKDFNWRLLKSEPEEIPTHRECPMCGRSTMIAGGVCYGCGLEVKDFDNEIVLSQMRTVHTDEQREESNLVAAFRQKTAVR